jgi:hypothetical protein
MRNLRFNIANLLGLIVFFGVGFAALRESDDLWQCGLFTLTVGVLLVSILLAIHRDGAKRAFWVGFALFGWGYLATSVVEPLEARLLTTKGLGYLDSKIPGRDSGLFKVVFTKSGARATGNQIKNVAFSVDGTKLATSGRGVVRIWDVAKGKVLSSWSGTTENFIRIVHSLCALILAWLGGQLSRRLSRGSRMQPARSAIGAESGIG